MARRSCIWVSCLILISGCQREADSGVFQVDTLPGRVMLTTSARPSWRDTADGWHFEEVARYGARDGSASELSRPQQIAVDDFGRLYVSDSRPDVIKVFAADGQLVRTIGREGAGPGEYSPAFRMDGDGNICVLRLLGSDATKTMFDVFTADRSWRGPVVAPVALEHWGVDIWGKDELFAATVDEDDRPIIKRFRIVKWRRRGQC